MGYERCGVGAHPQSETTCPTLPMLQRLKTNWRELKDHEPGKRFQERYHRGHHTGKGGLRKLLFIGSGILVLAAGVFFLPAPGPGFLILLVGAGLLAEGSLVAARVLDWTEIRLRRLAAWGLRVWRGASLPVRIALVFAAILFALGAGYAAYQLMLAR